MLARHWPGVAIHDDIKRFDGKPFRGRVDLLTGGFPCQPFSVAGKRGGADDDRYLWPEMLRVIDEIRPAWVIGENVAGFIGMGLDQALSDMEGIGYSCGAVVLPACALNAPHRRDRIWIIATNTQSERGKGRGMPGDFQQFRIFQGEPTGGAFRGEVEGRYSESDPYSPRPRLEGGIPKGDTCAGGRDTKYFEPDWSRDWREVAFETCDVRMDDGVSGGMEPNRAKRLKALGNAIVPQVAYHIIKLIPDISGTEMSWNDLPVYERAIKLPKTGIEEIRRRMEELE